MGRAYLIIILVGVMIGAMLPSGSPPRGDDRSPGATDAPLIVEPSHSSATKAAAAQTTPAVGGWTTLDRGPDGHFYADVQVNGVSVHFLVDTGASGVALSAEDARRVGLPFFANEFSEVGRGASGAVRGKLVTLDRVSLGGKSVEQVSGAILEGSEMSLLGQSFLGRMGTIEISGDRMTIR